MQQRPVLSSVTPRLCSCGHRQHAEGAVILDCRTAPPTGQKRLRNLQRCHR